MWCKLVLSLIGICSQHKINLNAKRSDIIFFNAFLLFFEGLANLVVCKTMTLLMHHFIADEEIQKRNISIIYFSYPYFIKQTLFLVLPSPPPAPPLNLTKSQAL